jgi:superfamily II DNA/RNA helicase
VSTDTTFTDLAVPRSLADVLATLGITTPTPIQAATLPDSLTGRDILGRGRTGSGKTYAFLLPLVARLSARRAPSRPGRPRALILAPTRELVTQIDEALAPLAADAGLTRVTVFGGVSQNRQVTSLRCGVDVVLACPGRLEDLMGQGHIDLRSVEITVLDEADHMADLGFLPGVRRIMDTTPRDGQRMLFSATLDAGVDVLVKRFLSRPATHQADSAQSPTSTMTHHLLHVSPEGRVPVLVNLTAAPGRSVVFTRTKHGAKKLAKLLNASGVTAVELHGNLRQNARTRNMDRFHRGDAATLVATDIAARGIHVDDVGIVIHADPPVEHKAYLHRSGRTARAGADGVVVTLITDDQVRNVRDLTRQAGVHATTTRVDSEHPLLAELAPGPRVPTRPVNSEGAGSGSRSLASRAGSARPAERSTPRRPAATWQPRPRRSDREDAATFGGAPSTGTTAARATGRPSRSSGPRRSNGPAHSLSSWGPGGAAAFSAGTRVGARQR